MNIGLLLLRFGGWVDVRSPTAHKIVWLVWWTGLDGSGQFFTMIGFSPGRRHALMAGLAETGGGLLRTLGLITPLASAALISVMLVAVFGVHIRNGFFGQNGGDEYNLVPGDADTVAQKVLYVNEALGGLSRIAFQMGVSARLQDVAVH